MKDSLLGHRILKQKWRLTWRPWRKPILQYFSESETVVTNFSNIKSVNADSISRQTVIAISSFENILCVPFSAACLWNCEAMFVVKCCYPLIWNQKKLYTSLKKGTKTHFCITVLYHWCLCTVFLGTPLLVYGI
jgi:predicted membrane protein